MADPENGAASSRAQMPSMRELAVIGLLLLLGLGVPILAMIFPVQLNPSPTIISILLGVGVATLVYYLLGGVGVAALDIPWVKLGGSAALLIATAILTHGWLETEKPRHITDPAEISALNAEKTRLGKLLAERDSRIERLTLQLQNPSAGTADQSYELVAAARPDSSLGQRIRKLATEQRGPFNVFDGHSTAVRITFHRKVEEAGKPIFTACDQLNLAGKRVRFAVSGDTAVGETEPVSARFAGTLPSNQCEGDNADRIQLSCESARALIPAIATGCSAGQVQWIAGNTQRYFTAIAEVYTDGSDR